MQKKINMLVVIAVLFCLWPFPVADAADMAADTANMPAIVAKDRQQAVIDPIEQALGEELPSAKKLPAAFQQQAYRALSALRTVALVLIGASFVISLVKTALGAVRGDGFVWSGALALVISALCFVAVLHAKTILYLAAQLTTDP